MNYNYGNNIRFKGPYRHQADNEDILFRIYGLRNWRGEPIDALHYLMELLGAHPELTSELARSPLTVALFFEKRGIDIIYVDPRPDENGSEWSGNGNVSGITYEDGKLEQPRGSGAGIVSCEVGAYIALTELKHRRMWSDRDEYIRLGFRDSWPDLASVVDLSIPVTDFNQLLEGSETSV